MLIIAQTFVISTKREPMKLRTKKALTGKIKIKKINKTSAAYGRNGNSEKYPEIGGRNAGPIINDLEPLFSIIFQGNLDASGSGVQTVFD